MRNLFNPRPRSEYITDAAPEPAAPERAPQEKKTGLAGLWSETLEVAAGARCGYWPYNVDPTEVRAITAVIDLAAKIAGKVIAVDLTAKGMKLRKPETSTIDVVGVIWSEILIQAGGLMDKLADYDSLTMQEVIPGIYASAISLAAMVEAVNAAYRALREERAKEDINE